MIEILHPPGPAASPKLELIILQRRRIILLWWVLCETVYVSVNANGRIDRKRIGGQNVAV